MVSVEELNEQIRQIESSLSQLRVIGVTCEARRICSIKTAPSPRLAVAVKRYSARLQRAIINGQFDRVDESFD